MDESDHAKTSDIPNWDSRMLLSLANHDTRSNAPLSSRRGIEMVFTEANFVLAPKRYMDVAPDRSVTRRYATATYPFSEASQKPQRI